MDNQFKSKKDGITGGTIVLEDEPVDISQRSQIIKNNKATFSNVGLSATDWKDEPAK